MKIIGIIAEYNPFHNGHKYHINKIKELYPDSIIILVINGYFLERGEISILTKEDKTKIALENNIDIILELPVLFGTQSADTFADKSIEILNSFNVDTIIFGSECNNINILKDIAIKQLSQEFQEKVKTYLSNGINYPTALAKALNTDFTFNPNDLLGISYIKSTIINNYNIDFITIKRTNSYHDIESNDKIISASNIREKLKNNIDIKKYLPNVVYNKIKNINNDIYFKLLKAKIITDNNLDSYLDVDEGIEYRLKKYINNSSSLDEFVKNIKTKRYTYNKLNRMFIHILLGIKKNDAKAKLDYIKILGFNKKGRKYIQSIKDNLKISNKINKQSIIYNYELKASMLYDLINNTNTYSYEIKNKPESK